MRGRGREFQGRRTGKFGLDASSLRAANPKLIVVSITGFARTALTPSAPATIHHPGQGGMMSVTAIQTASRAAGRCARRGDRRFVTGMYACVAILARCTGARRPEGAISTWLCSTRSSRCSPTRRPTRSCPATSRRGRQHPPQHRDYQPFEAADHRSSIARRQRPPVRTARSDVRPSRMGERRAFRDQRRAGRQSRRDRSPGGRLHPARTAAQWFEKLVAAGIPAADQPRGWTGARRRPAQHRAMVRTIGGVPLVGSPVRIDGERCDSERPPPRSASIRKPCFASLDRRRRG